MGLETPAGLVLLCAVAAGTVLSCGPAEPSGPDAHEGTTAADVPAVPTCPEWRVRSSDGCCPVGTVFAVKHGTCQPIGPPECAETLGDDPAGCVPRWCADWVDVDIKPCDPSDLNCLPRGRRCGLGELQDGAGCPAGYAPTVTSDGKPSGCHPAGGAVQLPRLVSWTTATVATLPLPALPPPSPPRWCSTASGGGGCSGPGTGCPAGEAPVAGKEGTCAPIEGVSWICPPGHLAHGPAGEHPASLPGCTPDPAACGDDVFAGVEDGPGVVFVDGKWTGASDGSRAAPYASLAMAVTSVQSGGTVVVGAGTYDTSVVVDKPLTIRGRCAALVTLRRPKGKVATIRVNGENAHDVTVRDLTLAGSWFPVIVAKDASATVERCHIRHKAGDGLAVQHAGSKLSIVDSFIDGADASVGGGVAYGVRAIGGAWLAMKRVRLRRSVHRGVLVAQPGSKAVLDEVLIDETRKLASSDTMTVAASVVLGARLEFDGLRIALPVSGGLRASGKGTHLTGVNLRIDDVRPQDGPSPFGRGLLLQGGARAEIRLARIHGTEQVAVATQDPGTRLVLRDALVAHTSTPPAKSKMGFGASAHSASEMILERCHLHHHRRAAIYASGAGTKLHAREVLVAHTQARPGEEPYANGVLVRESARVVLERARIHDNGDSGIDVADKGVSLQATDVIVDGTRYGTDTDGAGSGIAMLGEGNADLLRVRCSNNTGHGVLSAYTDGLVRAAHVVADGNGRISEGKKKGRGFQTRSDARLILRSALAVDNRYAGLACDGYSECWTADLMLTAAGLPVGQRPMGAQALLGGDLHVDGARIFDNQAGGGLTMVGNAALAGGHMARTAAEDDAVGVGLQCLASGKQARKCALVASRIEQSHSAAVQLSHGAARIDGSVLVGTRFANAKLNFLDEAPPDLPMADGVLAADAAKVDISRCIVHGNGRAGVMFASSAKGTVDRSMVADNLYGLATEKGVLSADGNGVFGNKILNIASEEGLFVPPPPKVD